MSANNKHVSEVPKKQPVSARKAEANRQNASKSTGPRTEKGKACSRRNAFKHGLFATYRFPDFLAKDENMHEFRGLLDQLREYYQPCGVAEELEVERIGICWWRLRRASRYENAKISVKSAVIASRAQDVFDAREYMSEAQRNFLQQLENAEKEIEAGLFSPGRKKTLLKARPGFEEWWLRTEESFMKEYEGQERDLSPSTRFGTEMARVVAHATVQQAIKLFEAANGKGLEELKRAVSDGYALQSMPDSNDMESLLRYESMVEKELKRAHERLEDLQERRLSLSE